MFDAPRKRGNFTSFTYDAFGRRQKKTLGTTVTSYLYDGANAVQELTNGTPSANTLTGLGIDEVFQRSEGATARTFLSDALGSTLALADTSGVVQTSYTYAPYGAMTFTGTASNNTSQFTGRENDSDGLYFYRARYYHPVMSRFVSEDPIGFGGGDANLYGYVSGDPVNVTDPSGRIAPIVLGLIVCGAGALAGGIGYGVLAGRKRSVGGFLLTAAVGCGGALLGFFGGGVSLSSLTLLASRVVSGASTSVSATAGALSSTLASPFVASGTLSAAAVAASKVMMPATKLGDPVLRDALVAEGAPLTQFTYRTTQQFWTPNGAWLAQVHFLYDEAQRFVVTTGMHTILGDRVPWP